MLIEAAFLEAPDGGAKPPLQAEGSAHRRVNRERVGRLLARTRNASAPGGDKMGAEIVKVMWEWAPERITALVRACIELGHHPEGWKTAEGVAIPKPGKPDYTRVRAHRVRSLLDSISKLVERTAAHLIADHLERRNKLHDGQYGCRKRICVRLLPS